MSGGLTVPLSITAVAPPGSGPQPDPAMVPLGVPPSAVVPLPSEAPEPAAPAAVGEPAPAPMAASPTPMAASEPAPAVASEPAPTAPGITMPTLTISAPAPQPTNMDGAFGLIGDYPMGIAGQEGPFNPAEVPMGAGEGIDAYQDILGPLANIAGHVDRYISENGINVGQKPSPLLTPQQANEKYGIPGVNGGQALLKFDKPINEDVAKELWNEKQDQLQRQIAAERPSTGFWSNVVNGGANLALSFLDPLNLAMTLVPGVGEEAIVGKLAEMGLEGMAGRVTGRAIAGGLTFGMAQAPISGLELALSRSDIQQDYDSWNALTDMAGAFAMGGIMHNVGGALGDIFGGVHETPLGRQLADDPITADAAFRTAVAQAADERPVEVSPVLWAGSVEDAAQGAPPGFTRFYHGGAPYEGGSRFLTPDRDYAEGYAAKSGGIVSYVDIPNDSPYLVKAFDDTGTDQVAPFVSFEAPEEIASGLRPTATARPLPGAGVPVGAPAPESLSGFQLPTRAPESLVDYLIGKGGVKPDADLLAMDLDKVHHRAAGRLLNPHGLELDKARELAVGEGFLKPNADINDLRNALGETRPVYRPEEAAAENLRQSQMAGALREHVARKDAEADISATLRDLAEEGLNAPRTPQAIYNRAVDLRMQGLHPQEALELAHQPSEAAALAPEGFYVPPDVREAFARSRESLVATPFDVKQMSQAADQAAQLMEKPKLLDAEREARAANLEEIIRAADEAGLLKPEDKAELAAADAEIANQANRDKALMRAAVCLGAGVM